MGRGNGKLTGIKQSAIRPGLIRIIEITRIETPLGEMVAGATDNGICLLEFIDRKKWLLDQEKKYSGQPVDISLF
jgi:hypothetical protein